MSGLKWTSVFGASYIFLTISVFSGVVSQIYLGTTTETAQEGKPYLLSCYRDFELLNVEWIRNVDIIFKTKSDSRNGIFPLPRYEKFRFVSGRLNVSTSLRQHNVTLRINFTIDDRSNWRCKSGGNISNIIQINNLPTVQTTVQSSSTSKATTVTFSELSSTNNTITTVAPSTDRKTDTASPVTENPSNQNGNKTDTASPVTEKPSNQNDNHIYIIAASAGGGVVVIVIVVVVCVVCVRKKRTQNTPTKNTSQDGLHPAHESQYDNNETGMVDNALYSSGYMDHDYSTVDDYTNTAGRKAEVSDDTRVTDVYAQVQKKKDKTEVQVTVNIEDLYAKPVKKKKGEASISVQNNVNISIGQIADEDV